MLDTGVELVPAAGAGPGPVTGVVRLLGSAVGKVLTWPVAGIGGWAVTGVSLVPTLTD